MNAGPTVAATELNAGSVRRCIASFTPAHCRLIFAAFVLISLLLHVVYLHHCLIDLSGDEAHYWDWSRQLDYGYYSKGPLVAWIIRASCAAFGNTMPAVRYPAVLLAAMSSCVVYALTRLLFRSDRLALGASLLFALMPMFVAGSLLMTIDPPLFFCWALATYGLAQAALNHRRWGWSLAGVAIGIGVLAKFGALLWLPGALLFIVWNGGWRRLAAAGPWLMVLLAVACTSPVVVWNAKHDWVSFRHVARQIGVVKSSAADEDDDEAAPHRSGGAALVAVPEFLAGQIGVIGPGVAALMLGAAVYAVGKGGRRDANRPALKLLVAVGGTFWLLTLADNFRSKVQVNWTAPAYFTLTILAAYFTAVVSNDPGRWRAWRNWFYAALIFGLVMLPITHDFAMLYPAITAINAHLHKPIPASKIDPTVKLRGWHELGQTVGDALATMPPGTFILCDDYQQTAETAFYTPGQPITFCAGSYFANPKRHTQYDIWPDRQLDPSSPLVGRDAIYVGKAGGIPAEVRGAFAHVEPLPILDIVVDGVKIRSFRPWRCTGFRGLRRASDHAEY